MLRTGDPDVSAINYTGSQGIAPGDKADEPQPPIFRGVGWPDSQYSFPPDYTREDDPWMPLTTRPNHSGTQPFPICSSRVRSSARMTRWIDEAPF